MVMSVATTDALHTDMTITRGKQPAVRVLLGHSSCDVITDVSLQNLVSFSFFLPHLHGGKKQNPGTNQACWSWSWSQAPDWTVTSVQLDVGSALNPGLIQHL